jgi:hypothetical protein
MKITPNYDRVQQSYSRIQQQSKQSSKYEATGMTQTTPAESTQPTPVRSTDTPTLPAIDLVLGLLNGQQGLYRNGVQTGSGAPTNLHDAMLLPHASYDISSTAHGGNWDGTTSQMISSDEIPGGFQLDGVNAADVAAEIINTVGSNGTLKLSDVDKLLGVTTPETGAHSPEATIAWDWNKLTDGSGQLSASQLATAIESYLAARKASGV